MVERQLENIANAAIAAGSDLSGSSEPEPASGKSLYSRLEYF
jgi:hypothetical protein